MGLAQNQEKMIEVFATLHLQCNIAFYSEHYKVAE